MERFKHTIVSKFVEYAVIVASILRDVRRSAPRNAVWFVVLALAHIGLVFASLSLLYTLGHSASKMLSQTATAQQAELLFLMLGLLVIVLIAAAIANYGAARNAVAAAGKVELLCAQRVLDLVGGLPRIGSDYANHVVAARQTMRVVTADSRYCGMAGRLVLLAFPDIVLALGSLGIMLYIQPWLTVLLVVLSGLLTLMQYPTNLQAAAASRELERSRPEFIRHVADLIAARDRSFAGGRAAGAGPSLPEKNVSSFYERLLYIERGSVFAQISSAVVLCTAILVLLYETGQGELGLPTLLLYVAAARQALSNITRLSRSVVAISRLFPQLSRYFRFIWSATGKWPLLVTEHEVRASSYNELRRSRGGGSEPCQPLVPGRIYRVFARQDLGRSIAAAVLDGLGLSKDDSRRYEPHLFLSLDGSESPTNAAGASEEPAGSADKKPWLLIVLPARPNVGAKAEPTQDGAVRTEIYVSTYNAASLAPQEADVFVVLGAKNEVTACTTDRSAALGQAEMETLKRTAAAAQADEAAIELEEEEA